MNKEYFNLTNYRLPPEWDAHEATWLSWLKNSDTWPTHVLNAALPSYIEF